MGSSHLPPLSAVERNLQAVCSFLMVGQIMAGQRFWDAWHYLALHCLAPSHTSRVKSRCLSKGLGTQLTSKNKSMKSLSRGTQLWDNSDTIPCLSPLPFPPAAHPGTACSCLPDHISAIPTSEAQRNLG